MLQTKTTALNRVHLRALYIIMNLFRYVERTLIKLHVVFMPNRSFAVNSYNFRCASLI